jgi:hypothetical protein
LSHAPSSPNPSTGLIPENQSDWSVAHRLLPRGLVLDAGDELGILDEGPQKVVHLLDRGAAASVFDFAIAVIRCPTGVCVQTPRAGGLVAYSWRREGSSGHLALEGQGAFVPQDGMPTARVVAGVDVLE